MTWTTKRVLPAEAEEELIGVRVREERFMNALRFDEAVELLKHIYWAKGKRVEEIVIFMPYIEKIKRKEAANAS